MKKSDVFTRRYPAPTDIHLYKSFKEFLAYSQEVAQNWKEEVLSGMMGFRAYVDLRDVRLSAKHLQDDKDPAITISLKPAISPQISEQMAFYLHLFRTYRKLIDDIYSHMKRYRALEGMLTPQVLGREKIKIHQLIAVLRVLLMTINHQLLTRDHLDVIDNRLLNSVNAMVKGLGFSEFFDNKTEHPASFWHDTDQDLVNAFWRWSDRRYALESKEESHVGN